MKQSILNLATSMLVIGYLIHAINYGLINIPKMSIAMVLFSAAMYFLFV